MSGTGAKIGSVVRKLREESGLSQQQLASKVGVPRPALSQIEGGSRKVSADELLKFSRALNASMPQLMGVEPLPTVSVVRDGATVAYAAAKPRISVPGRNLGKLREVLLYILAKVGSRPHVGETVLYKLLYFIDFDFYERYEEQLIGAAYVKNHHGPTPVEFKKVVEDMIDAKELERVRSAAFNFPQTKYLPLRAPDLSLLSARELDVIEQVLSRLSGKSAARLAEYSHNDVPWKTTEDGKRIDYEAAFYRTPEYSMRDPGDAVP